MEAIIKLDVPDWQIGQEVTVFFKDTMMKHGVCEKDNTKILEEEYSTLKAAFMTMPDWLDKKRPEVVRCKHCKHYEPEDKLCCHPFGAVVGKIPDDFYCEYGERKEGW